MSLLDDLNERARSRWATGEARALGWGGVTAVAKATGMSDRTIRNGIKELNDPAALSSDRQRKPGAGRKPLEQTQAGRRKALDALIEPTTRGSPTNPLRWTIKSTARLADEMRKQGFTVSATSVRRTLVAMKYSFPGHRKTREGHQHPDRDGQFRHISQRVQARQRRGEPALSVDTKKREVPAVSDMLRKLNNAGQTFRPKGQPLTVKAHDFPDPQLGKAVHYGVYDIHLNEAGVSVSISHDTTQFARAAIRRWWFVPLYDPIEANADQSLYHLSGQRLQLLGQDEFINSQGERSYTSSNKLGTTKYVQQFTAHLPELAVAHPALAELQNLFDWMVVRTLIRRHQLDESIQWKPQTLGDTALWPTRSYPVPTGVDSVAATNRAGRTVLGLVGGVDLNASAVISRTAPLPDERKPKIPARHETRFWND